MALGHDCERFLVYKRTRWQEEQKPDDVLLSIFEEGGIHEKATLAELAEAGFQIIEQQTAIQWKEHQISGQIDGALVLESEAGHPTVTVPVDVKSSAPYAFDSINSELDVRNHTSMYIRGYFAQMQLYLLLKERDLGALIFKNKLTGLVKVIEVHLDYAYCETLVQKADRINAHVKAGTLPDRVPYTEDLCGRCSFFNLCLPDEPARAGIMLLDNPEMAVKIRRRLELEKAAKEYERLDKQIKDEVKQAFSDMDQEKGEAIVNAEFVVRMTSAPTAGYVVAPSTKRTIKIERLGRVAEA